MEPLTAVLAIAAVFLLLGVWVARTDGLAFLAPGTTRALRASAQTFCTDRCRTGGLCPLTQTAERAGHCPLFRYVTADVDTMMHGSPFEAAR